MIFELVGIFVTSFIAGLASGYFLKVSSRILLFFLGFYVVLTALLWYLGIIVFTVSIQDIYSRILQGLSNIRLDTKSLEHLTPQIITVILGGTVGFYFGVKKA